MKKLSLTDIAAALIEQAPALFLETNRFYGWPNVDSCTLHMHGCSYTRDGWWRIKQGDKPWQTVPEVVTKLRPGDEICLRCAIRLLREKQEGIDARLSSVS